LIELYWSIEMLAAGAIHRRRVVRALVTLLLSVLVAMAAVCSELAAQTTKRSKQLNVRGFIAAPRATLLTFEPDPRARELLKPVLKAAMMDGMDDRIVFRESPGIRYAEAVFDASDQAKRRYIIYNAKDIESLAAMAFDHSRSRWLGISDLITEPEGPSIISSTVAQRRVDRRCS
jgi:hypothetical protein